MEPKKTSQKAVKSIINRNTILLHISSYETGKRTNLKRAVSECVYVSRLYFNTELQAYREKMRYLSLNWGDKLFKVEQYDTHIAAINEYTEYHIDFGETSKYYTIIMGNMRFLIVSDMGYCNIYQVFDGPETSETSETDKEYKLTVEFRTGQRFCYYGKTKKQAIAEFKRNFGNFKGFIKKEWEIINN